MCCRWSAAWAPTTSSRWSTMRRASTASVFRPSTGWSTCAWPRPRTGWFCCWRPSSVWYRGKYRHLMSMHSNTWRILIARSLRVRRMIFRVLETTVWPDDCIKAQVEQKRAQRRGEDLLVAAWSRSTSASSIYRYVQWTVLCARVRACPRSSVCACSCVKQQNNRYNMHILDCPPVFGLSLSRACSFCRCEWEHNCLVVNIISVFGNCSHALCWFYVFGFAAVCSRNDLRMFFVCFVVLLMSCMFRSQVHPLNIPSIVCILYISFFL